MLFEVLLEKLLDFHIGSIFANIASTVAKVVFVNSHHRVLICGAIVCFLRLSLIRYLIFGPLFT